MLIFVPSYRTAVFLARIVIPFSRSRSPVSMTRSLTSWFARNAPDCQSIASTRVVLPWSTWATMAMLRMSLRSGTWTLHEVVAPHHESELQVQARRIGGVQQPAEILPRAVVDRLAHEL